jgi:ATP-binding cassette subfamily B protein
MSRHVEYDLKNEIYNHYQNLPLSFYRKNNTGDLMNRISDDVGKVRMYIGPAIMYGINLLTIFCLVLPVMFNTNPKLAVYSLIPLPFLSLGIYLVSNKINKQSERIQSKLSDLSTFVQEAFSGIRVIKSFTRENDSAANFLKESNAYRKESIGLALIHALFHPIIYGLIGLSTIMIIYIGGFEVINGNDVTYGDIAKFFLYLNLITWPVTSLGWVTSIVQRAAASQKRLSEFLDTKNDIISEKNDCTEIKGSIEFQKANFTYENAEINAIHNLTFSIPAGGSLALVGNTGCGKSTIANLITRMFDINNGQLLIDGKPIKDYSIAHLRNSIGYIPQDAFLFSDTIYNNIAFGKDHATKKEIETAAKQAGVYESIMSFPDQFNTILGERGITLSGGQKQRLTLARSILKNPKILILDDSLSAVDTKTENDILSSLEKVMEGKTSIIIAHRYSTIKLADKIVVLDKGTVVEEGSHEELLKKGGFYKAMYESQLEKEV